MKAESFGYKNAWIAARVSTPQTVAEALGLSDIQACDWSKGIAAAYEGARGGYGTAVFLSPALDGWVLCVGTTLFRLADDRPPEFAHLITRLARELDTEVQFFCTHRIVESHGWARATENGLQRAYLYVGESGETVMNIGPPSLEEMQLGFSFFDENGPESEADGYWEREDLTYPDEEDVMRLAGRWSLDPSKLQEREIEVGSGILGQVKTPRGVQSPKKDSTQRVGRPWWKFW
jgi:hypothetical protein